VLRSQRIAGETRAGSDAPTPPRAGPDNDFLFGTEDPEALRCPFGAHIRRANPRDGLKLGDAAQQAITNRHRLLRRGRPYEVKPDGGETTSEKGLMFACLCADLERQFEFVQQTWIGSSSFHGLTDEVDPIIGSQDPVIDAKDQTRKPGGRFTIPTPSGPVTLKGLKSFVSVRAGGYFFMPSLSALQYLCDLNREAARQSSAAASGQGDDARPAQASERERLADEVAGES
jgi:deferrochelatase/peroxidase EfeB